MHGINIANTKEIIYYWNRFASWQNIYFIIATHTIITAGNFKIRY